MDRRMIAAIVLVGAVLALHFLVIMPLISPRPTKPISADNAATGPAPQANVTPDNGTKSIALAPAPKDTATKEAVPTPVLPAAPAVAQGPYYPADNSIAPVDNLTLQSPYFTTCWTNRWTGACLNVTFRKFYTTAKHDKPLPIVGTFDSVLVGENEERPSASLVLEFPELAKALEAMTMKVASADAEKIVFTGRIVKKEPSGAASDFLDVTKTVRLSKDKYEIEVEVTVKNLTAAPLTFKYDLRALEGMNVEGDYKGDASARVVVSSEKGYPSLKTKSMSGLNPANPLWQEGSRNVVWAGIDDRYFATACWATKDGNVAMSDLATAETLKARLVGHGEPVPTARVKLTIDFKDLAPMAADARTFHLFAGPKESAVLDTYSNMAFPALVDYGIFGFIAILIVWLLRGIYFVVRNYGLAILIMTVIIRIALHPLTKKGQVAMAKMQRLKPKIQELQKRYKNDKQKLAQEQMKLFREGGVSPMSGCLPMLLQMPILFALFWALRLAFEMRQSPFVWWMNDLSLPDTVGLPFMLPLVGSSLHILPVLMTVAMFIQQLMQPKAEDEQTRQQQKMMMFLPFLFMFMFYSFPAGLNLYWFASTVFGIAEQWYIQRHITDTLGPVQKA